MTINDVLKRIEAIYDCSDYETKKNLAIARTATRELIDTSNGSVAQIERLRRDLIAAIAEEEAKKNGTGRMYAACKAILKDAAKVRIGPEIIDGRQYIGDSSRLVVLDAPLDLPTIDNPRHIAFDDILEKAYHAEEMVDLELPNRNELSAWWKAQKAHCGRGEKVHYDFGPMLPYVDAEYLLHLIDALPGAKATVQKSESNTNTHVIVFVLNGRPCGILAPIRVKDDCVRERTVLTR